MGLSLRWRGQTYFLYDVYDSWREAYNEGRRWKRENGSRYFIEKKEVASIFNYTVYKLYLTKARGFF